MNDYDEARKTSYREVRSHWIDIVDNYNQAISLELVSLDNSYLVFMSIKVPLMSHQNSWNLDDSYKGARFLGNGN